MAERIFYKGLTPELEKKAEQELNEYSEVRVNALKEFRELIDKKQDVHGYFEDEFLLRFLRVKKFNVQKAHKILRNHVKLMQQYSDIFTCKAPSEVWEAMNLNAIAVPPDRLNDLSLVVILRIGLLDPSVTSTENYIACLLTWSLIILEYEVTQISGFHLVIDFAGATFRHYKPFATLPFVKFVISILQDCTPVRIAGIHLVNEPVIFRTLLSLAKYLITKKIRERVYTHGSDLDALHDLIPKEFVPPWLGGTCSPIDNEEATEFFLKHELLIQKLRHHLMIKTETE